MLCFIMALKSKAVSNNWEQVSCLCEASIRSAYQQTNPNFKIIVICHETPTLKHSYDDRLEIINVDFPPPPKIITELTMQDKWKKLAFGMVRAGKLKPDYIMLMDADDLVSCKLAEFVNSHKSSNGWILKKGYRYSYGSPWIYVDERFNCGTNAIVNCNLIQFPENTASESIDQCVLLSNGHTAIENKMRELKHPLEPLPFLGAIYTCDHGDNDSDLNSQDKKVWNGLRFYLGKIRRTRPLSRTIKKEFAISI